MSAGRPIAVVTDVDQRVGLYAAQCLGRMGYRVIGTVLGGKPASDFIGHVEHVTHAELGDWLNNIARVHAPALALPVSINACAALSGVRARGAWPWPTVLVSPARVLRLANDKFAVCEAAARAGVGVPRFVAMQGGQPILPLLAHTGLPAVLKLRDDIGTWLAPSQRYTVIRTEDDAHAAQAKFTPSMPLLLQSYVEGQGGAAAFLVAHDGTVRAQIAYRRVREYPASGGPSTVAETVHYPALLDAGRRIVHELGFAGGIAHVEFKLTPRGPVVMEVNPRLWGTVRLAEYAGQPFVQRWVEMALGRKADASLDYRDGVRTRFLANDLKLALGALRRVDLGTVCAVAADLTDPYMKPLVFDATDVAASRAMLFSRI